MQRGIDSEKGNPSETGTPYKGEQQTLQAFFQTHYSRSASIYLAAMREFVDQRADQIFASSEDGGLDTEDATLLLKDLAEFNEAIAGEALNLMEQSSPNSVDSQLAGRLIAAPEWLHREFQASKDVPPAP